jgi:phospholipid-binding lipoprotein MlaA
MMILRQNLFVFALLSGLPLLAGCAGSTGNSRDPLEPMNRAIYQFNDKADYYVMKPVAEAYRYVAPQPVRTGVRNFFSNMGDISSTVNYSLQGKPESAFYCFARTTLNSTAGLLGFFDVTGEDKRRFPVTGFGDTFAHWGWKDSSYLVLPLLGPSTLRDGTGVAAGAMFQNAVVYGNPHDDATLLSNVTGAVSAREGLLGVEDTIQAAALDPYSYTRDVWLQIRSKTTGDTPIGSAEEDIDIDDLMK